MRLIDADELKIDYGFTWSDITPTHEEMYALIDRQPTIDAVKHGRWIRTTKADYAWECSACGYGLCDNRTTYCYDCGAKMDETVDE